MGSIQLAEIRFPISGTWGLGTAINLPTATDPALGSRQWQLGPPAVVVMKPKNMKWMVGGLVLAPHTHRRFATCMAVLYHNPGTRVPGYHTSPLGGWTERRRPTCDIWAELDLPLG